MRADVTRRGFLGLLGGAALASYGHRARGQAGPPGFLIIVGEGMGWSSTSVQMDPDVPGSAAQWSRTPNLARIADGGLRLARAYAPSPRCTPSRAALLTGLNPARLHMTFVNEEGEDRRAQRQAGRQRLLPPTCITELPAEATTVAGLLREGGYATAHFGKWHVGRRDPTEHGFDESDGPNSNQGPVRGLIALAGREAGGSDEIPVCRSAYHPTEEPAMGCGVGLWWLGLWLAGPAPAGTWVVSVGVERYDDVGITPLAFAAADATSVAEAFRGNGAPAEQVLELTTAGGDPARRPTKFGVLRALQSVRDGAAEDDRVVVFFAGHGVERDGEVYLLTADSLREELADTALAMTTVRSVLATLRARHVLFLIDACRNDPDSGRGADDAVLDAGLARGLRPHLAGRAATFQPAMILACDVGQRAWEMPDRGHGAFTFYVLQGLAGAAAGDDGTVSVKSLAGYLERELPAWAERARRHQTPRFENPAGIDFPVLGGPRPTIPAVPEVTVPGDAPAGWPTHLAGFRPPEGLGWGRYRVSPVDGMPQVLVPAGEFWMGSPDGEADRDPIEGPERRVYLSAFWMDLHEVTCEQYVRFLRAVRPTPDERREMIALRGDLDGLGEPLAGGDIQAARGDYEITPGRERYPVRLVSWLGAQSYAHWAGRRLPSEAQWEKAARAGTTTAFPWGAEWEPMRAVVGEPQAVASVPPNAFGLFDMIGNVKEWCADIFDETWYERMPETDPLQVEPLGLPDRSDCHSLRGGSYRSPVTRPANEGGFALAFALELRSAFRGGSPFLECGDEDTGFRCVAGE